MRRTSLRGADCPIARSLDEIGDWWTLLIVRDAFRGARRFTEFQKSLGLAKNILAQRLRLVLVALRQWGEDNLFAADEEMTIVVEKATGQPISRLKLTALNGRPLEPEDVITVRRTAGGSSTRQKTTRSTSKMPTVSRLRATR